MYSSAVQPATHPVGTPTLHQPTTTTLDESVDQDTPWTGAELDRLYSSFSPQIDALFESAPATSFTEGGAFSDGPAKRFAELSPAYIDTAVPVCTTAAQVRIPPPSIIRTTSQLQRYLAACKEASRLDLATAAFAHAAEQADITPDLWCWGTLMEIQLHHSDLPTVLNSVKALQKANLHPDRYIYHVVIRAYIAAHRLEDAFKVYERLKATGIQPDIHIYTSLTKGCIQDNDIPRAWSVFDHMRFHITRPDEVMYSLMIHACAKTDEVERAMNLLEEMSTAGLYPTDVTYTSLIEACARRVEYHQETFQLLKEMIERGYKPNAYTYSALIRSSARVGDHARARYLTMCLLQADPSTPSPPTVIFANLLRAYATAKIDGSPNEKSKPTSVEVTTSSLTFPLDPASPAPMKKHELIREARIIFDHALEDAVRRDVPQSDLSRLTHAYLSVYTNSGLGRTALEEWARVKDRVEPTGWIFLSLLTATDQARNLPEAWSVWEEMQAWWKGASQKGQTDHALHIQIGRSPEILHKAYISMIKTLARAKEIPRAVLLVQEMSQWVAHLPLSRERPTIALGDFFLLYTRCIEGDEHAALLSLLEACPPAPLDPMEKVRRKQRRHWGVRREGADKLAFTPYQWRTRIRELRHRIDHPY